MKIGTPRRLRWLWIVLAIIGALTVVLVLVSGLVYKLTETIQRRQAEQQSAAQTTADVLASRARQQQQNSDFAGAERSLEEAIQKQARLDYELQLAVVQYQLKKYELAIERYTKVLDQSQEKAFIYNGIGNAYRDWSEATPDNQAVTKSERRTKAIESYARAYAIDPKFVAAYSNLALFLADIGDVTRAKDILKEGIAATDSPQLRQQLDRISTR
jgi:tetratricopeptide (TPR) repeat protein